MRVTERTQDGGSGYRDYDSIAFKYEKLGHRNWLEAVQSLHLYLFAISLMINYDKDLISSSIDCLEIDSDSHDDDKKKAIKFMRLVNFWESLQKVQNTKQGIFLEEKDVETE